MSTCLWQNCSEILTSEKMLYEHMQKEHIGYKRQGTLTNECHWKDCNFKCDRRDRMRSHVLCHIDCKLFECDVCAKSYKWKHDLYAHQRKVHQRETSGNKRRKSMASEPAFYLPSQDRRNSISQIDFNALNLARNNVENQCDPNTFCISPNETTDYLSPAPSRRHSVHTVAYMQQANSRRPSIAQSISPVSPSQMYPMPPPPMQFPMQLQQVPSIPSDQNELSPDSPLRRGSLQHHQMMPNMMNQAPGGQLPPAPYGMAYPDYVFYQQPPQTTLV
eukprot:NODE_311_length_10039_cov_0.864487.p5 type:complete len:275 gc:universal NODE_311_length_10039_cov_0.864487:5645-6469(+)